MPKGPSRIEILKYEFGERLYWVACVDGVVSTAQLNPEDALKAAWAITMGQNNAPLAEPLNALILPDGFKAHRVILEEQAFVLTEYDALIQKPLISHDAILAEAQIPDGSASASSRGPR